ncbi:DUF4097 family beta strand repeat-containing protein [Peribacillus glennii]|uniref:DUF4097 domain-containing protein n=1 Tax=Peribacillus glennii TaxID=2303991 RepID=A0A372LDS9_9BACI|nr:DUF4097 domain-containing protein [Peribacillus glennii]RFU63903.1 DUF4097 domain-containing protein [Peribacillus glennii]
MQEEKKRILQLVQDGQLSADEALGLLEELEKAEQASAKKEETLLNELVPINGKEESYEKSDASFQKKIQSSKEKLIDFIDSAIKKMKEADLDFNFGSMIEMSHIFHQSEVLLKEINIEIANGKASLIPWDQHELRVECKAKVYRVKDQEEARKNFLRDVMFQVHGESFRFASRQKTLKVEADIYIPKAYYDRITVRMFNGSINGTDLQGEKIKAKTANGPINFMRLSGKTAELETANGGITIEHASLEKLEAETLNGSIVAEGILNKVDAQSFTGDILCDLPTGRGEYIHARTVTGKIYVNLEPGTAVNGQLKSNIGSLSANLPGIEVVEEKNEVVQKVLTFKTGHSPESVLHIFADTKTGAISIN